MAGTVGVFPGLQTHSCLRESVELDGIITKDGSCRESAKRECELP